MNHLAKVIYKQLEDLNYLDKHLLKALHNTGDTLIIQGKEYQVRIDGSEILNPNHEVDLNYQIVENENGYLLAVNDGRSLPGPIYLHFYNDQEIQLTDYNGYIYIEENDQCERMKMVNQESGEIIIDEGGSYLFSQKNMAKSTVPGVIFAGLGGVAAMLLVACLLIKKRYWFW